MFCVYCGAENPDFANFCLGCGKKMEKPKQSGQLSIESPTEGITKEHDASVCEEPEPQKVKPTLVKARMGETWICPSCGNAIEGKYDKCPYCQEAIMLVDPDGVWICPECYEENRGIYTVCSSCGYHLTQEDNPPTVEVVKEDNGWTCRRCGSKNVDYDNVCFYCGTKKGEEVTLVNSSKQHNGTGCYRHPDRQAVAQCPNCGAFMCQACYNRYEGHMCKNCTYENNKAYISRIRTSLIWAAVFLVWGWIIGVVAVGSGGFLIGLWAAGLPGGFVFSGWDVFATKDLGCLGMVFYWIFRLLAASVVGLILTIINIFRLVRAISVQRELEDMDIWD